MSKQQSSFHLNDLRENSHLEQYNGVLDELNLPPGVVGFLQKNQRKIWTVVILIAVVVIVASLYDSYRTYTLDKAAKSYDEALLLQGEEKIAALNKTKDRCYYRFNAQGVAGRCWLVSRKTFLRLERTKDV